MFDNDHNICTVLEVTLACPVCVTLTGVESKAKARQRTLVPFQYKRLGKATMNLDFEKSLCLGSGIAFGFLLIFISVSNGFIMIVLYKNPLRCFRKSFSMFLVFIAAVDLFIGTVVCSGEAVMRLLCAFGDGEITQDRDVVRVLGYFGINSSILLATAMSVDRLIAIVWPYFYISSQNHPQKCRTIQHGYLCLFLDFCLASVYWSFDGYLPYNRCSFTHYLSSYDYYFSLLSDIFLFEKKSTI